ncbi:MAG: type II secretion system F family protein [Rubripirellula sp.]|nr:type II secretion system F family protein [Rubripirellula sp.]
MSENPFPESELPRWLYRKAREHAMKQWRALPGYPYETLARFSHDFGTCVRTVSDLIRGMELCVKSLSGTVFANRWAHSAEMIRGGASLAEALTPAHDRLPAFYLPVVRAGEKSGRLVDAFQFLETHCKLLAGPAAALRKLWLYPLFIFLVGSALRVFILLVLGSPLSAIGLAIQEIIGWLKLVVFLLVITLPPILVWVDEIRLNVPMLGDLEKDIALNRFFRVLSLMYSVGEYRVEAMIQTAAAAVTNQAAKNDLLQAADAIENHASVAEAFAKVRILTNDQRATIDAGELSGTLDQAFAQLSTETGDRMTSTLALITPILTRLVMIVVVLSILATMFNALFARVIS